MSSPAVFHPEDLCQILPAPGYYSATVTNARFRHSSRGNRMLHIVHSLQGVSAAYQCLADYFVLEGVSPQGLFLARRRLVELYRACGFLPEEGQEIRPSHLLEARLQVKVEHEFWNSRPRLRIVGYYPSWPAVLDAPASSGSECEGSPHA